MTTAPQQQSQTDAGNLFAYALRLGDDALILSHRLSEMTTRAPELEQDIALANIALDLVGQARSFYTYAGQVEGKGRDEDALAFLRLEHEYRNHLLLEQPNDDFAWVIARQFLYDAMSLPFYEALAKSSDETLAGIAQKAIKEVRYHLSYAAKWVIRLGDGTEESHRRMQAAIDALWMYTGALFEMDAIDRAAVAAGYGVYLETLRAPWNATVDSVFAEATLEKPGNNWIAPGGRDGRHTEYMGYILAELQYMQRTYPNMTW